MIEVSKLSSKVAIQPMLAMSERDALIRGEMLSKYLKIMKELTDFLQKGQYSNLHIGVNVKDCIENTWFCNYKNNVDDICIYTDSDDIEYTFKKGLLSMICFSTETSFQRLSLSIENDLMDIIELLNSLKVKWEIYQDLSMIDQIGVICYSGVILVFRYNQKFLLDKMYITDSSLNSH